jgi:hypothetical protein
MDERDWLAERFEANRTHLATAGFEPAISGLSRERTCRRQSGYSSFRQARGSSEVPFGVRSSRKL